MLIGSQIQSKENLVYNFQGTSFKQKKIRDALHRCTIPQLKVLQYMGEVERGINVQEAQKVSELSYQATYALLRRLCGKDYDNRLEVELITRKKVGPNGTYLHFLNTGVTLEDIRFVLEQRTNPNILELDLFSSPQESEFSPESKVTASDEKNTSCNSQNLEENTAHCLKANHPFSEGDPNPVANVLSNPIVDLIQNVLQAVGISDLAVKLNLQTEQLAKISQQLSQLLD